MSTSVALSAAAMAQSSAALAAARAAQATTCKAMMPQFDAVTATVEQQQSYAECVELLHPQAVSPGAVMALKAAFVLALIGGAYGAWRGKYGDCGDWESAIMLGLFGFIGLPCAVAFAMGIVYGIYWLFT